MKTDNLIIFVMAPVTNTSGRVLRSGRTGLRRSQRTKVAPPTRSASRRNAKRLYQSCNEAIDLIRKKRKPPVTQQGSAGNTVTNSKSSSTFKRPIRKATRQALIDIGKVLDYESKSRSKDEVELDISSDDVGQSDLFIPSKGSTCASQSSSSAKFDLYIDPNINTTCGSSQSSSVTRLLLDHVPKRALEASLLPLIPIRNVNIGINTTNNKTPINDTKNNSASFSANSSISRSLLGHAAPSTEAPLLPPIDENMVNNVQHEKKRGENNTWFSSNLCASQNNDTITDFSSTFDESTAASGGTIETYKKHTNIAHKKIATKTKKHVPAKRSVVTSQNKFALTKMTDIVDVYKCFKLPKSTRSCIPPLTQLEQGINVYENYPKKWTGLINMSMKCIDQVLKSICPGPSRSRLKLDIAKRVIQMENTSAQGTSIQLNEADFEAMNNRILHSLFTICKMSKHSSVEKRVTRAIIGRTLKKRFLQSKCKQYGLMDISSGSIVKKVKEDFDLLMNGDVLHKTEQTRCKINEEVVAEAVSLILHKDHIVTTSWGQREFDLSNTEKVILPMLCRKVSPHTLWQTYSTTCDNKKWRINRSTFYNLVKDLTSSGREIVKSVDYVQALLVAEPIEILQQIIESLVHSTEKETLSRYLTATATFLKTRYQKYVLTCDDGCVTHDLKFVLERQSKFDNTIKTHEKSDGISCLQCRFPYFMCHKIKGSITTSHTPNSNTDDNSNNTNTEFNDKIMDAKYVIEECERKFKLFMAHKARCANQNKAIEEIHSKLKRQCTSSNCNEITAVMIGDYKMKFEAMSSRETTLDHYGKRGISWHGFCVQFYLLHNEVTDNDQVVPTPKKYTVYLDQIVSDGNKQDSLSVYSLLDAALAQISNELPFISSIILQTDNAKSYNNTFLLCAIPLLNVVYEPKGLGITEFIHTETQDGKTILDAHFARCMKFINHFMSNCIRNQVIKINTPGALGYALSHNGGIKNVGVQVVNCNMAETRQIEQKFEHVTKVLKSYFSRVNHAYFYPKQKVSIETTTDMCACDILKTMIFDIGVQSYSNINQIINFHIDMTQPDKTKVLPDKLLTDEINKQINSSLLDLHVTDVDVPNTSEEDNTNKNLPDFSVVNAHQDSDSSSGSSYDTDEEFSDTDDEDNCELDEKFHSIEEMINNTRRVFDTPNQEVYSKDQFITKVDIEMMLPIGKLTKFDHNIQKRGCINLPSVKRLDSRSQAIRIANDLIQQGDIAITSSSNDDPLLKDSDGFEHKFDYLPFEQGWGRRNNRSESTLYGNNFIEPYKKKLLEYFDQGKKNSSKKMNPAMMRDQLQKDYPNTFSLPGETAIKQHISSLFATSKKADKHKNDNDERETTAHTSKNEEWKCVVNDIVNENPSEKPENIYKKFLTEMTEVRGIDVGDLPSKKQVKSKITSSRTLLKNKARRSVI